MILWKKQKEIENAVKRYLDETEKCLAALGEAFDVYFIEGLSEAFEQMVRKASDFEASSDDLRREIEATMYDKALIPESRGDILGMLEALDLVPNKCESVLYHVWLQNTIVPEQFADRTRELVRVNIESYTLLCEAVRHLFDDVAQALPTIDKVMERESESDAIERHLIKSIFDLPGDLAEKILLKELFLEIGAISDRAENAADRIRIIAIKRQT